MGKIKGTLVCFLVSFLAICWPDGAHAAPSCASTLLKKYFTSDIIQGQQSLPVSASQRICDCYPQSPASQNPVSRKRTRYRNPANTGLVPAANSADQNQQLLNEATVLLNQLSYSAPDNTAIENQEKALLQNLVNRLEALKKNGIVPINSSAILPAISDTTYNTILNEYLDLRLLIDDSISPSDAEIGKSALDNLYQTFDKIITGQLLNIELQNLCSATLALNSKLKSINPPTEVQDAVSEFIMLLTSALTGQSQVTILGLCDCLNDLETSVVTVVENDKSQKLQYLLTNLVDAVTNAVVSGGDVGCNVIDVVRRYVASIKQAVQQDANTRAGKIYSSVLNFEEELYRVLIESKPAEVTTPTPQIGNTTPPPVLQTEEEYLSEITQLSQTIFGNRTNLVRAAIGSLLEIKNSGKPPASNGTTLGILREIRDLLKSAETKPLVDSTHLVEVITDLLSTLPQSDIPKVLDALDPVPKKDIDAVGTTTIAPEKDEDATDIINSGDIFIVNEKLVQQTNPDGNVDIVRSGIYNLVNPKTNDLLSGSYAVQDGIIKTDSVENIQVEESGVYDVNLPQNVKRQGSFLVTDNIVNEIGENGYPRVTESGTYSLTDTVTGSSKGGNFAVENTISMVNPDGSIGLIKAGLVYDPTGEQPSLDGIGGYFLFDDHLFKAPDKNGNYGTGLYNIINPDTKQYQSGTYVIRQANSTRNPDGSVNIENSGLIYVDGAPNSTAVTTDPLLIVTDGSPFKVDERVVYITDKYGNMNPVATGEFTDTDPTDGITKSAKYVTSSIVSTVNPDGSINVIKFGRFSDIVITAPTTEAPTTPGDYLEATGPTAIPAAAKPLPVDKNFFHVLMEKLKPVKTDKPTEIHPTTTLPPFTTDYPTQTTPFPMDNVTTVQPPVFDATSIISNGTNFIVDVLVTPLVDADGKVVSEFKMGTYHFTDDTKPVVWSGAFEVDDSFTERISPGRSEITDDGTFDLYSSNNNLCSKIRGQFSIKDALHEAVYDTGTFSAKEGGTYSVADGTAGASKTGSFVVLNTISIMQPDGASNVVKSGFIFLDEPGTNASYLPLVPSYDQYFLSQDQVFVTPDDNGNVGTGIYSITDPKTNEYTIGTYTIQKMTTINNPDGTMDVKTEGSADVDDYAPEVFQNGSGFAAIISPGVKFTMDEHFVNVTNICGEVGFTGTGQISLTDPSTGLTESVKYSILNVALNIDGKGSSNVRKFCTFSNVDDTTTSEEPLTTTPAPIVNNPTPPVVVPDPDSSTTTTPAPIVNNPTPPVEVPVPDGSTTTTPAPIANNPYHPAVDPVPDKSTTTTPAPIAKNPTPPVLVPIPDSSTTTTPAPIVNDPTSPVVPVPDSSTTTTPAPIVKNPYHPAIDPVPDKSTTTTPAPIANNPTHPVADPIPDSSTTTTPAPITKNPTPPVVVPIPDSSTTTTPAPIANNPHHPVVDPVPDSSTTTTPAPINKNPTPPVVVPIPDSSTTTTPAPIANNPHHPVVDPVPDDSTTTTLAPIVNNPTPPMVVPVPDDYNTPAPIVKNPTPPVVVPVPDHSTTTTPAPIVNNPTPPVVIPVPDDHTTTTPAPIVNNPTPPVVVPVLHYSTTTTPAPIVIYPNKPFAPTIESLTSFVDSLNPMKPAIPSETTYPLPSPEPSGTSQSICEPTVQDLLIDGTFFIVDAHVVPQLDTKGNIISLTKTGRYGLTNPQTNVSWSGNFDINDCLIKSTTPGEIDVTQSGTFDINLPDNQPSHTIDPTNRINFSMKDHVSVTVDGSGISRVIEGGTYEVEVPTTGESKTGNFIVTNSVSLKNPDNSIDVVKSGILYVDKVCNTPTLKEPPRIMDGGYFLTDQHVLSVPDSNGNYGSGSYNIKDPKTNEYTSGTYVIKNASTINNPDGTVDAITSGIIYVDGPASSSPSTSSDPSLAIINEAEFTFVDHFENVTDQCGHVTVVGTGSLIQIDPKTKSKTTGNYVIRGVMIKHNPDGSEDQIEAGIFHLTTNCNPVTPAPTTKPPADHIAATTTPAADPAATLSEINASLQALINSLAAFKTQQGSPAAPPQLPMPSKMISSLGPEPTPVIVPNPNAKFSVNYVTLPRLNVASAMNGQCLLPGDVVVVQANNGNLLTATIQDLYTPVTFYITNLADLNKKFATASRVFTVPENDFSKQDRSLLDAVLNPPNSPNCVT